MQEINKINIHEQTYLFLGFFSFLGLTSCMDDVEVREKPVTNVTDLKVPADFSWKMSHDVLLSVESPVETTIEIFSSEGCEKNSLLATLRAPLEDTPLSVANSVQDLYIRYTKKDGTKGVVKTNTAVTRGEGGMNVKLPENTGSLEETEGEYWYIYPSGGYGTLLFEDNWPVKGDYDLNDVAARYKIQLEVEDDRIWTILVNVQLTALGGSYPYQLCMKANDLKENNVKEIEDYTSALNPTGKYSVSYTRGNSLLVAFDWKGLKGSDGGLYYNTEDGHLAASLYDNQVSFAINLKKPMTVKDLPHDSFDFFIRRTDSSFTEVHLKGYKPTEEFMAEYNEEKEVMGSAYYSTKDNFVWGIKVPASISHPKERVSILEAYPDFKDWVMSNGDSNENWYEHGVSSKLIPVN